MVDCFCSMTRIAWLVDSSVSNVPVTSEWDNAGNDVFRSLEFIRILVIEQLGFAHVASNPKLLDEVYGKFLQAGHRLASETLARPSFRPALDALADALRHRGRLADLDVVEVIQGASGRSL